MILPQDFIPLVTLSRGLVKSSGEVLNRYKTNRTKKIIKPVFWVRPFHPVIISRCPHKVYSSAACRFGGVLFS
jgi:hypothetical protein